MNADATDDGAPAEESQEFEADRPIEPQSARSADFIDANVADDILEGSSDYPIGGRSRQAWGDDAQVPTEGFDRIVDANREPLDRPLDTQ